MRIKVEYRVMPKGSLKVVTLHSDECDCLDVTRSVFNWYEERFFDVNVRLYDDAVLWSYPRTEWP